MWVAVLGFLKAEIHEYALLVYSSEFWSKLQINEELKIGTVFKYLYRRYRLK